MVLSREKADALSWSLAAMSQQTGMPTAAPKTIAAKAIAMSATYLNSPSPFRGALDAYFPISLANSNSVKRLPATEHIDSRSNLTGI